MSIGGSNATLWMGDLDPWMDENFIKSVWASIGETSVTVKVIRDKMTGMNAGYCFVDFPAHEAAQHYLNTLNGTMAQGLTRPFRLNWSSAAGNPTGGAMQMIGPEYSVFVGDLAPEVTELMLLQLFQSRYLSVKSARIMTEPGSGKRGWGFVKFSDEAEQMRSISEMTGTFCGSRPIRVNMATQKNAGMSRMGSVGMSSTALPAFGASGVTGVDPNNTTIYVGGVDASISDAMLRGYFSRYGDIVDTRFAIAKNCAFIQFTTRHAAELAIEQMNGAQFGTCRIKTSWGKAQITNAYPQQPAQVYPQGYQGYPQHQAYGYVDPYAAYGYPTGAPVAAPAAMPPQVQAYVAPPRDPLVDPPVSEMNKSYLQKQEEALSRTELGSV